MQSRILVTGGSGFIGTHVVARYENQSVPVLNLDVIPPRRSEQRASWRRADLLDAPALRQEVLTFNPTHIFHLGARTDLDGTTAEDYHANTEGVHRLLDVAAELPDLQRIVFASSRLVCRIGYQPGSDADYCPTTAYGRSKVEGEQIVRQRAQDSRYSWTIVRPTSIWGPWFGVPYRNFFDAVRAGRYLHPRGRRIRKSFGYIGNSVHQLDRLMFGAPDTQVHRRMFYLCDYEPLEVRAWAEVVRNAFDAPPVREVPLWLLRAAAVGGDLVEAVGARAPLTSFRLDNLLTEMLHETAALEAVCGELPYTVAAGVRETVDWMRSESSAQAT